MCVQPEGLNRKNHKGVTAVAVREQETEIEGEVTNAHDLLRMPTCGGAQLRGF